VGPVSNWGQIKSKNTNDDDENLCFNSCGLVGRHQCFGGTYSLTFSTSKVETVSPKHWYLLWVHMVSEPRMSSSLLVRTSYLTQES
jgi:hypothetical protein